ncbi:hypothetical protein [Acetatifactor muris]|uniref:hypothetical protein n=1 Tax=Acetatifactor muris TaxID=879566 RepID=UPI0023F51979|nr:hypothetical protein [Acetatifactor muris]
MDEQTSKTITAFDSLFTTNRIQMLKILLPWLAPGQQGGFAVYIKLLELQYTLTFLRRHSDTHLLGSGKQLSADFFQGDNDDTLKLLDELIPFSSQGERSKIENMKNMMANFRKMQEMMDMMKMMQELFPEGMGTDNPMDMFSGMSDSGLSSLFQMFGAGQEE